MTMIFDSRFTTGPMFGEFSQEEVKNEPMFFNCDPEWAFQRGGSITRAFIDYIWDDKFTVFDSRVHMLMPGWYPAIPGLHHDDVPRLPETGQPAYGTKYQKSEHAMGLVNGEICPTEFAVGTAEMSEPDPGAGPVYKQWHIEVEAHLEAGKLRRVSAPSNQIVYFDADAFHQGTAAVKNGWRWFGRASRLTERQPTNEIRRQVQVYLENPMEGW